ncbi:hypothetical protein [Streptomyces sp. NPDC047000]|uniref:hypothetical protein n=1 Tax=Streptomyces sp. NPDC047000 TaxID=3155474 RepID=UPI0033C209CC
MPATGYVSPTGDARKVNRSGDTMTGDLVLADSTPDTAASAASKEYTDTTAVSSAAGAVTVHVGATDPHGDRAAAVGALAGHVGATDPHGDRAAATTALDGHVGATDPHGDRTAATTALTAHAGGSDPHGDRAYADDKFATKLDLTALGGTVNSLSSAVSNLDGFVSDCLTRVQNIEQGTAYLNGGHYVGPVDITGFSLTINDGNLLIVSSGTAINRLARGGDGFYAAYVLANGPNEADERWAFQMAPGSDDVRLVDAANGVQVLRFASGATARVGFLGAAPVARQSVTGSRSDGSALASLLTALAALGLITDGSTL